MKKLFESTTTGCVTPGGYNKPMSTVLKRQITITDQKPASHASPDSSCPCKNLPGKVTCGLCSPRKK